MHSPALTVAGLVVSFVGTNIACFMTTLHAGTQDMQKAFLIERSYNIRVKQSMNLKL